MKVLHRLLLHWIYMLCFFGGFINTVSIVKFSYTVSHFTGHVSKVAINIGQGNLSEVFKILSIIIAFALGSTISGFLVDGREFNLIFYAYFRCWTSYFIHYCKRYLAIFLLPTFYDRSTKWTFYLL